MPEQASVSIITPAYNQADFLPETIESVLAQDYPRIEYIVLDDGSTDDTPAVLRRYEGRLRAERHANMGQAETLNRGWMMCAGEFVGYLSSDDVLYPTAISKLAEILRTDPGCVCVFPDADLIDERSRPIKRNVCRPFDLAELVVRQECYIGPGALFRRDAFLKAGGWRRDVRLAPDREFWMRIARYGSFRMVPETLAGYRMHTGSISYKETAPEVAREYVRVLDDYFAGEGVPEYLRRRSREAYGYAHLVVARACFRSGRFAEGMREYRQACELHPQLRSAATRLRLLRNVASKPARILAARLRALAGMR